MGAACFAAPAIFSFLVVGMKTRIKLTVGLILLIFVEAIIKHFCPGFPFAEAIAAQVAISGWYLEKKTRNNIECMRSNGNATK